MEAITYTTARQNLKATMDKVCDEQSPVIVTRQKQRAVVIISLDEYNSMVETAYLLQSPANAQRLMESIAELDNGKGKERQLLDPKG